VVASSRRKPGRLGPQVGGYEAWLLKRGYSAGTVRNMLTGAAVNTFLLGEYARVWAKDGSPRCGHSSSGDLDTYPAIDAPTSTPSTAKSPFRSNQR